MSQVMNPQEVMRISVLGYNFADWVKQFKEAFKKSDGTYDYMAYLAQLNNPSGFFLLNGSIGSDETNDFLNSLLTPTLDRIEIVGGMGQKGGGILIIILLLILTLFAAAIDSSLTTNTAAKELEEFRKVNPLVDAYEDIQEPEVIKGWLWNTEPTPQQKQEFKKALSKQAQLQELIYRANLEAEKNQAITLKEQDRLDKESEAKLEQARSETQKKLNKLEGELVLAQGQLESKNRELIQAKEELTEAQNRNNVLTTELEKYFSKFKDAWMEAEVWKRNCLLLGFSGCFAYIVTSEMQRNRKNYMIGPQYLIPKMQGLIVMGINNGNIVQVYNPETGTKNYWTNKATIDQLSAALGLMVGNMLQAALSGNNNNDGNGAGALGYDPSMRSSSGALGYDPGMRRRGGRKTRRLKKLKKINNKTR